MTGEDLIDFCEETYNPEVRLGLVGGPEVDLPVAAFELQQEVVSAGIFPNPVADHFTFAVPLDWDIEPVALSIYNLQGQLLREWSGLEVIPGATYTFSEGIAQLPVGQYLVRITRANDSITYPLVKQ